MATPSASVGRKQYPYSSKPYTSAIGKVFAVTELVEKILQHLPFLFKNTPPNLKFALEALADDPDIDGIAAYSEPQSLFAVLRVNRKFNATIKGSKMLRRLMFLDAREERCGHSDASLKHYQRGPLYWLANIIGYTPLYFDGSIDYFAANSSLLFLFADLSEEEQECWERTEASWRNIVISHYLGNGPITMDLKVRRDPMSKIARLRYFKLRYTESFVFDSDETLGDVWRAWAKVEARGFREHVDAVADLVDECEL